MSESELSPKAKEAFARAEEKAAQRRQKHQEDDAARKAKASKRKTSKPAVEPISEVEAIAHSVPAEAVMSGAVDAGKADREKAANAAMALVAQQRVEAAAAKEERTADSMYYVRCHVCNGPGIWMYKNKGTLSGDDWHSAYKPRGVVWPSNDVPCQCCLAIRGQHVSLKMLTHGGGVTSSVQPYERMVVEISRSEYDRLAAEADAINQADAPV